MSTTTEPTPPPTLPPELLADAVTRPVETAPSRVLVDAPNIARAVGFAGLFLLVLGIVVVVLNMTLTPRWIGKGGGYLFAALGVALMLYHSMRDAEQEVRRLYGLLALVWLLLGVLAAVIPGPLFESAMKKESGYNLLPGIGFGFLSLVFAIPFARQETDDKYRGYATLGMLVVGAALAIGSISYGLFKPDFLVGPGIGLALLGLAFLCAYMGQVDTSEGIGYQVAFVLGAAGAGVALYAVGRAAVPTLLSEGPGALRKASQALDTWKAVGRGLMVLLFAAVAAIGLFGKLPQWLRLTLGAIGLAGAAILVAASTTTVTSPQVAEMAQKGFLVPGGLILIGLGLVYLVVSLGICSDIPFVALTRRELASYFLSPIGYLVLGGMVMAQWFGYWDFFNTLKEGRPLQEPIVRYYLVALIPVFAIALQIPILTMRLMAEEKRSGSLEVLLTAPVNETPIILSKFVATWIFFMISWVPAGLFLVALRVETDQPFDYRPMLSFYAALGAQGAAFVGMGLFCSSLTRNQIIAAFLSLSGMVFFILVTYLIRSTPDAAGIAPFVQIVIGRLSTINMWQDSLSGQLPLRDVLLLLSLGVFFLFLSVKVLETRKWN